MPCNKKLWLSLFVCQHVKSFNMNPNKWMLVNFDCSAMWWVIFRVVLLVHTCLALTLPKLMDTLRLWHFPLVIHFLLHCCYWFYKLFLYLWIVLVVLLIVKSSLQCATETIHLLTYLLTYLLNWENDIQLPKVSCESSRYIDCKACNVM